MHRCPRCRTRSRRTSSRGRDDHPRRARSRGSARRCGRTSSRHPHPDGQTYGGQFRRCSRERAVVMPPTHSAVANIHATSSSSTGTGGSTRRRPTSWPSTVRTAHSATSPARAAQVAEPPEADRRGAEYRRGAASEDDLGRTGCSTGRRGGSTLGREYDPATNSAALAGIAQEEMRSSASASPSALRRRRGTDIRRTFVPYRSTGAARAVPAGADRRTGGTPSPLAAIPFTVPIEGENPTAVTVRSRRRRAIPLACRRESSSSSSARRSRGRTGRSTRKWRSEDVAAGCASIRPRRTRPTATPRTSTSSTAMRYPCGARGSPYMPIRDGRRPRTNG